MYIYILYKRSFELVGAKQNGNMIHTKRSNESNESKLVTVVEPTPLKNDGLRQLGS